MTVIALTTQNRRTITNHAGRCRRFTLARVESGEVQLPLELVELEIEQTLKQNHEGLPAALQGIDVLITAGAGQGMAQRLKTLGVQLCITPVQDPLEAAQAWAQGRLPQQEQAAAADHDCDCDCGDDHDHGLGHGQGHSCGCAHCKH